MEITWYGERCLRLKGREGTVAADAYRHLVGPTGRGLTADIATYSHPDPSSSLPPTGLDSAKKLDSPGEYEVHDVLVTGVRTFRDDAHGAERGPNVSFVYELDGLHAVHLGDIGHLLTEDMLGEIGTVDVACVPVGGTLTAARAAELIAQLDVNLILPLPVAGNGGSSAAMERFLHEMGVQPPDPVARLTVTISSLPQETTLVMLEPRKQG